MLTSSDDQEGSGREAARAYLSSRAPRRCVRPGATTSAPRRTDHLQCLLLTDIPAEGNKRLGGISEDT